MLGGRTEVLNTPVLEALEHLILLREEDEEDHNTQVDKDVKLYQVVRHALMATQSVQDAKQQFELENELSAFMDTLHQYTGVRGLVQAEQKLSKFTWAHERT